MAYWLIKAEPENDWSWDEQVAKGVEGWDGVRNYAARQHLNAMKKGDQCFFYHSGKEKRIMGIVAVAREAYPDASDASGKFVMVDVKTDRALKTPVTLAGVRAEPRLAEMRLVRESRLSVAPVEAAAWKLICKMGGIKP
jgi:predicted RNA-binding protein with PUA-like domain